jgi:hypothetical protein
VQGGQIACTPRPYETHSLASERVVQVEVEHVEEVEQVYVLEHVNLLDHVNQLEHVEQVEHVK